MFTSEAVHTRKCVIIVDFGSQFSHLITKVIRKLGFFSELIAALSPKLSTLDLNDVVCFILSGGPNSIYEEGAPKLDVGIIESGKPILGICYGMQLLVDHFGGQVSSASTREYGSTELKILESGLITDGWVQDTALVWMSHGDAISLLPPNFKTIAVSKNFGHPAIIEDIERNFVGIQFHPEVKHSERGEILIENFLLKIANAEKNWTPGDVIKEKIEYINSSITPGLDVLAAVSGGVDSTVAASLLHKAFQENNQSNKLVCVTVDTGLLRKGEMIEVQAVFKAQGIDLIVLDKAEFFLKKLQNVSDPEQKRKIIGASFIEVFKEFALNQKNLKYLMQGTLYTDVIESFSPIGAPSAVIKSHHNVGGLPAELGFELVEPFRDLFKDEVRELGKKLHIAEEFLGRHPFPGPGLAIRIDKEVTFEKLELLRAADSIFMQSIRDLGLYSEIWQAFAFLSETRSVGVMGDQRTYERLCVLRAITSSDGMTARPFYFDTRDLERIASEIINKVSGISRVCFDCTSKPPATIEFQ